METTSTDLYETDPQADADWLAGEPEPVEFTYTAFYSNGATHTGRPGWPMGLVRAEADEAILSTGARIIALIGVTR